MDLLVGTIHLSCYCCSLPPIRSEGFRFQVSRVFQKCSKRLISAFIHQNAFWNKKMITSNSYLFFYVQMYPNQISVFLVYIFYLLFCAISFGVIVFSYTNAKFGAVCFIICHLHPNDSFVWSIQMIHSHFCDCLFVHPHGSSRWII